MISLSERFKSRLTLLSFWRHKSNTGCFLCLFIHLSSNCCTSGIWPTVSLQIETALRHGKTVCYKSQWGKMLIFNACWWECFFVFFLSWLPILGETIFKKHVHYCSVLFEWISVRFNFRHITIYIIWQHKEFAFFSTWPVNQSLTACFCTADDWCQRHEHFPHLSW